MRRGLFYLLVLFGLLFSTIPASAQNILNRVVTFEVNRQELSNVLEILSNKGNFYFSYNSRIIRKDSLVTLSVHSKTVLQVLDMLFREGYEFKESGNYIIIRRTPIKIALVTTQTASDDNLYYVTGYVLDDQTGERVNNASVYEKDQLTSTITNQEGYFRLKLKSRYKSAAVSVSKQYYIDTTVVIQPKFNQELSITIMPMDFTDTTTIIGPYNFKAPDSIMIAVRNPDSTHWLYTYRKADSVVVEKTAMGKFLLSSWQKIQSINLKKFFVVRPYQVSLVPGMSTNGKLNSQVTNNFSFNVLGGYSGGVDGFELGGAFNIDKKDVHYVQIAGLLNVVGGSARGVQIAGLHNAVLDSVSGLQVGGIGNFVKRDMTGWQFSGIYNHIGGNASGLQMAGIGNSVRRDFAGWQLGGSYNLVAGSMKGLQLAGNVNFAKGNMVGTQLAGHLNINLRDLRGAQIAGLLNVNLREIHGAQIASLLNYTKRLKGVQIGLVNIADTSEGYSIGLINIIFKGYHKLSFYASEIVPFNVSFKTGNTKLYSILLGGVSAGYRNDSLDKLYTFGYGLGREFTFNKRWGLNTELTTQYLYLGTWDYVNLLTRLGIHARFKVGKFLSVYAGPAFSVYYSTQPQKVKGYKFDIQPGNKFTFSDKVTGWFGFHAGIDLF